MLPRQYASAISGLFFLTILAAACHADTLPNGVIARFGSPQFRHGAGITSIAFLDGGRVVASGGGDGHVRLWDFLTGRQIRKQDFGGVTTIALSPDAKRLAVSVHGMQVWDVKNWKLLHRFTKATGGNGWSGRIAWSADGKHLAGGMFLNIWDLDTGRVRLFRTGELEELHPIRQTAYLFGGKYAVALGDESGAMFFIDPKTGKHQRKFKAGSNQFTVSPCGNVLARQDTNRVILLEDMRRDGKVLRVFHPGKAASVLKYSPDGRYLAVGAGDGNIQIWSVESGKKVRSITAAGYVAALAFSPNGRVLASGGGEGVIRSWEIATGSEIHPRTAHDGPITTLAITNDGKKLVSGSRDGTICMWDTATPRPPFRFKAHDKPVRCIDASPVSRLLASAGDDAVLRIWDCKTGRLLRELPGIEWNGRVAFSPDGKLLAGAAMLDGNRYTRVAFWDTTTWRLKSKIGRYSSSVSCLAFSPNGKQVAVASYANPSFGVWNVSTSALSRGKFSILQSATVIDAEFTRDGKNLIASSQSNETIENYDLHTGKVVRRFSGRPNKWYTRRVIALSPNGKILANGEGNDVVLWDVATGKAVRRLMGHIGPITALEWSPGGATLFSGSADGTILQWDFTGRRRIVPVKTVAENWNGEILWEKLQSQDAAIAYRAMATLVANRKKCIALLSDRLEKSVTVKPEEVKRLVMQLSSKRYIVREKATNQLIRLGPRLAPTLREMLPDSPSLEMLRRIQGILAAFDKIEMPPDAIRELRAIEALEYLATNNARKLLRVLAAGAAGSRSTVAAKNALGE